MYHDSSRNNGNGTEPPNRKYRWLSAFGIFKSCMFLKIKIKTKKKTPNRVSPCFHLIFLYDTIILRV